MFKMLILLSVLTIVNMVSARLEDKFINFGSFVCPREDKAMGRCLRDALNSYIPQLATGVPEYGLPPCEPLVIPTLSVEQTTGAVSITSSYSDVTVRGPSTMRIKKIEVDTTRRRVIAKLHIPELRIKGKYKMSGNILLLPIEGEGQFSGNYGDIDAVVKIVLGRQPRHNSVDALSCEDLDVKFHVGHASVHMDNLFGGDGELGKAMNKYLNDNWKKLTEELQKPMEDALRDFLKPVADHAFATLDADDVFEI